MVRTDDVLLQMFAGVIDEGVALEIKRWLLPFVRKQVIVLEQPKRINAKVVTKVRVPAMELVEEGFANVESLIKALSEAWEIVESPNETVPEPVRIVDKPMVIFPAAKGIVQRPIENHPVIQEIETAPVYKPSLETIPEEATTIVETLSENIPIGTRHAFVKENSFDQTIVEDEKNEGGETMVEEEMKVEEEGEEIDKAEAIDDDMPEILKVTPEVRHEHDKQDPPRRDTNADATPELNEGMPEAVQEEGEQDHSGPEIPELKAIFEPEVIVDDKPEISEETPEAVHKDRQQGLHGPIEAVPAIHQIVQTVPEVVPIIDPQDSVLARWPQSAHDIFPALPTSQSGPFDVVNEITDARSKIGYSGTVQDDMPMEIAGAPEEAVALVLHVEQPHTTDGRVADQNDRTEKGTGGQELGKESASEEKMPLICDSEQADEVDLPEDIPEPATKDEGASPDGLVRSEHTLPLVTPPFYVSESKPTVIPVCNRDTNSANIETDAGTL